MAFQRLSDDPGQAGQAASALLRWLSSGRDDKKAVVWTWDGITVPGMALAWPLRVGHHEVVPVEIDAWTDKFHLVQRRPGDETLTSEGGPDGGSSVASGLWLGNHDQLVWELRTLCGRAAGRVSDGDGLDLLGADQRRLCQSCWRAVEGWLRTPGPGSGESEAVAWAVATVLEIGEALIDGVPIPRFEPIRRAIRAELKAAVGGSVRTAKIGPASLWVWSGLVNEARTPEARAEEMQAAVERMSMLDQGDPVPPARWRGDWNEIIARGRP